MADLLESVSSKASAIAELAKRLGNPELMLEISDLKMQVADLKIAYAALQDENLKLINKLKEDKSNPLQFRNALYWAEGDNIPFCPVCYEANKDRHHLIPHHRNTYGVLLYKCGHCDSNDKKWFFEYDVNIKPRTKKPSVDRNKQAKENEIKL
jgi:hypothetical protein